MSTLTIKIDDNLKNGSQKKAKKDGVTLTFIISQALQAYSMGKLKFGLINEDEEITASFDVSTKEGSQKCLKSFNSLCK